MDERAKYGPIPVSTKAEQEAAARAAAEEAERAAEAALEEARLAGLPPPVLPYSSLFIFSRSACGTGFFCVCAASVVFSVGQSMDVDLFDSM